MPKQPKARKPPRINTVKPGTSRRSADYPDDLLKRLEAVGKHLERSRAWMYVQSAKEFVERHEAEMARKEG